MRRIVVAAVLLALTLPAAAWAVPPNPGDTVIQVLGRKLYAYAPNGIIDGGHVSASAQGETVDGNGNGLADALRGRGALLERHGVTRLRMYSIRLQVVNANVWEDLAIDDQDVVASGEPAYLVNYTPTLSFCPQNVTLTYRVVHKDAIRWDDGRLGTRTTVSHQFQARAVVNTGVC
jgi:hypothetical protein